MLFLKWFSSFGIIVIFTGSFQVLHNFLFLTCSSFDFCSFIFLPHFSHHHPSCIVVCSIDLSTFQFNIWTASRSCLPSPCTSYPCPSASLPPLISPLLLLLQTHTTVPLFFHPEADQSVRANQREEQRKRERG